MNTTNESSAPGKTHVIVIDAGEVTFIHDDALARIYGQGKTDIRRASHVEPEPDCNGRWMVDLSPVGGQVVRGFALRGDALEYERQYIEAKVLLAAP